MAGSREGPRGRRKLERNCSSICFPGGNGGAAVRNSGKGKKGRCSLSLLSDAMMKRAGRLYRNEG